MHKLTEPSSSRYSIIRTSTYTGLHEQEEPLPPTALQTDTVSRPREHHLQPRDHRLITRAPPSVQLEQPNTSSALAPKDWHRSSFQDQSSLDDLDNHHQTIFFSTVHDHNLDVFNGEWPHVTRAPARAITYGWLTKRLFPRARRCQLAHVMIVFHLWCTWPSLLLVSSVPYRL